VVKQRRSQIDSSKRRQILPKEIRRKQLIRATMGRIAEVGLSQVTLSAVTQKAGLSQGIANLHFDSKDNLLVETLKFVTDEYNLGLQQILSGTGYLSAQAKLQALVQFQFSRSVTEETKMAVWFAFYGEAKSRPTYQSICADSDRRAALGMKTLMTAVSEELGHDIDTAFVTDGYIALIDGLWLSLLLSPRKLGRVKAKQVVFQYLKGVFPLWSDVR